MATPKGRILCTEDNEDTRELLAFLLEQNGFEAVCVDDPLEAINLAKTQHFDLYLLDNKMPGLSGTAMTEQLREFDPHTPVLFCSGAAFDSDKEAAQKAGAQAYLVKPVDNDLLLAEVSRLISESRSA